MFQEQSDKYMVESMDTYCKEVFDIHNEQQIADFMAKEQSIRLPLNGLQWRCFFISDYDEKHSVFVFKVHHSLADGIALALSMVHLNDHPRYEDYPNVLIRFSLI